MKRFILLRGFELTVIPVLESLSVQIRVKQIPSIFMREDNKVTIITKVRT